MYVEYCNYNKVIKDYSEEIDTILTNQKHIDGIAAPLSIINKVKEYLPKEKKLATSIDYPLGYSNQKTRLHAFSEALKSGANIIDFLHSNYNKNLKYEDGVKEIETVLKMCSDYNAVMRIFLTEEYLASNIVVARLYSNMDIDIAISCLGYHNEDFYDNLLLSKDVESKTNMSVIFAGQIWQKQQIELLKKSKIFGVRLYNMKIWCN